MNPQQQRDGNLCTEMLKLKGSQLLVRFISMVMYTPILQLDRELLLQSWTLSLSSSPSDDEWGTLDGSPEEDFPGLEL